LQISAVEKISSNSPMRGSIGRLGRAGASWPPRVQRLNLGASLAKPSLDHRDRRERVHDGFRADPIFALRCVN
jgi:hypothetical protein